MSKLKSVANLISIGLLLAYSNAYSTTCTSNQSPVAACEDLLLNQPNLTITIPNSVTIARSGTSAAIWNDAGAIGTTLVNNGTIINTWGFGVVNVHDHLLYGLSTPANVGTMVSFTNNGTINSLGNGFLNGSSIEKFVNAYSINSTMNEGLDLYEAGFIHNLTNIGTITSGRTYAILVEGSTSITTLNNLQGASTSALTYSGNLPSNYNIIIRSPNDYGQMSFTSVNGIMNFGVYGAATGFSPATYTNSSGET